MYIKYIDHATVSYLSELDAKDHLFLLKKSDKGGLKCKHCVFSVKKVWAIFKPPGEILSTSDKSRYEETEHSFCSIVFMMFLGLVFQQQNHYLTS